MILHSRHDGRELNITVSDNMQVQKVLDKGVEYNIVIVNGQSYAVKENNAEIWKARIEGK